MGSEMCIRDRYGAMGYRVFSFLFNWSDTRWDIGLRDRLFQFSPVFVSAESMRWWLGRECFAQQKCILSTREEGRIEDEEDEEEDHVIRAYYDEGAVTESEKRDPATAANTTTNNNDDDDSTDAAQTTEPRLPPHLNASAEERGRYAWYDAQFPPLALWVAGADDLVDGRRLLRRFDRGREPFVRVVHKKIIEGYEHLDVIWAMDCVEKVGKEVKEVIWRTASKESRRACRVPRGCEGVFDDEGEEEAEENREGAQGRVDGDRDRRESTVRHTDVKKNSATTDADGKVTNPVPEEGGPVSPTQIDATAGEWSGVFKRDSRGARADSRTHADVERRGKKRE